MPPSKQPS
jgi:hypothetical protein